MEVGEPGLSQRPEDGQAFRWPVLVGAQHLQVLWVDGTHELGRAATHPSPTKPGATGPAAPGRDLELQVRPGAVLGE